MKKITAFLLAMILQVQVFNVNIIAESGGVAHDIRFDFLSGKEGVTNITGNIESYESVDGEIVLTTKSANLANKQIHIELPQIDFGEGGYYMYAKISCELPEGVKFVDSMWGTQTTAGRDYVAAQGGNDWAIWDGTAKIRRLNTSGITGQQYLRMIYMMGSNSVTGVVKFHVDWIVLSKNPTLNESTALITAIDNGENNIILAQDGSLNEVVVGSNIYNSLTEGTTDGLPEGYTAEVASGVSDDTYTTTVIEKTNYKVVDITAYGNMNGSQIYRQYRIVVFEEEGMREPEQDIRFDFISGQDGVLNITGNTESYVAENGEIVITTKSANLANKQFHIELPQIDFGDGGYYMYAKIRCELPEGAQFVDSKWGTQTAPGIDWVRTEGGDDWATWDGTEKIRKFNISGVTGQQYLRMIYVMGNSAVTGEAKFYIDWIVLSKNAILNESTAIITAVDTGEDSIELSQDGSMNEIIIGSDVYNSLIEGTTNQLPEGFTEELAEGVNEVNYSTTVMEKENCKVVDIMVTARKDASVLNRHYRILFKLEKECLELVSDIRYDFIADTEGFTNITNNCKSFEIENGEVVVTTKEINLANKQIHIELPQVDFGEGGYYLYAKISCELPEGVKFVDSMWGTQTTPGKGAVAAQGGNDWSSWDGTAKIRKFNTSGITGPQYLRMIYMMGSSAVTGTAAFRVDWVALSKNPNLNMESGVIDEITIGGENIILPQNGSPVDLSLRTRLYNGLTDNNKLLPIDWEIYSQTKIKYEAYVKDEGEFKIVDLVVSDSERCRTYRFIAKLEELTMMSDSGSAVRIPGAINIIKKADNSYECDLYPRQYDLVGKKDIIVESSDNGEVVNIIRNNGNLSVVINDVEGVQVFKAECHKISSGNEISLETVGFNNGKISYRGSIDTTLTDFESYGEIIVAAFDENENYAIASGVANIEENGDFSGEFSILPDNVSGTYFDMKVAAYDLNSECIKYIKYYNDAILKDAVEDVKNYESGTKIFTGIKESQYKDLFETMGIWTWNDDNESEINRLLKAQSKFLTVDNFAFIVNGTVILAASMKDASINYVDELLCKYDREINKIAISTTSFDDIKDEGRDVIVKTLLKNDSYDTWTDFEHAVKEGMLFYEISTAEDYKIVDKLILENTDVILYPNGYIEGTILETLKNAKADYADRVMRTFVNEQGETLFDSSEELLSDLTEAFKKTSESGSSGTGGGGTGGSYGKGSGHTATITIGGNVAEVPQKPENEIKYNDLLGFEWAEESIYYLSERGVISGVGENRYEPSRSITREEFVKLICEAFDFELIDGFSKFKDVESTDWFSKYVYNAVNLGIVSGISDNEFGTGRIISREDMAVMLYRAMKIKGILFDEAVVTFSDIEDISDYAINAVGDLSEKGIINGVGNNIFSPKTSATRAEAAVIIYRSICAF